MELQKSGTQDGAKQCQEDTCKAIDERYDLVELDMSLTQNLQVFGSRRINVAVAGLGRMGAIHLYNVLRELRADLLYLVGRDRVKLDFMDKKYHLNERGVQVLTIDKWDQMIGDPRLEAVLIATPTHTHEKLVRSALEHNKHVMCEKPLAQSVEAVDSLVKLAASRNLKLMCAFQRRYDPSFKKIAEQIRRGDVGQVRIIKTCCRDSPTPSVDYIKISSGFFHDCFVHDLDVIVWFANELPREVHAYGHTYDQGYREQGDFDTLVICMKFPSGLISVSDLSRVGPAGYENRVEVFGPKGVLKIDELTRVGWEKHNEFGVTRPAQCYSFSSRYIEAYANEIPELFNHIEGIKTSHPIKLGLLQAQCKIIHAAEQSARSGKPAALEWSEQELRDSLDE